MSRARHGKSTGGGMPAKVSGNPDVFKEAAAKKRGGKVVDKADGGKGKRHMGKPGRKRGGRVGADKAPLSSAHGTSSPGKVD